MTYDVTPGDPGKTVMTWPSQSGLTQTPSKWSVVMAVHPMCPCTRASLTEFNELISRSNGRAEGLLLWLELPKGKSTPGLNAACDPSLSDPGIRDIADPEGLLAKAFGAETSGAVRIYDTAGELVFSGGITKARGQAGTGPAWIAAMKSIGGGAASPTAAPVFGCPLFSRVPPITAHVKGNHV
jgi:hypothetical protein